MKQWLSKAVVDFWYRPPSLCTWLLAPLSWLFQLLLFLRRIAYERGKKRATFPVPIIIVGNISVGGTGKTPLVGALVALLQRQGFHPGIVSRGYGGTLGKHSVQVVNAHSDSRVVGDEALLLFQKTGCPIVVGRNRASAVMHLLEQHREVDIVLSDDGLQHYALSRDIEIVIIDGARGLGNGFCLPAGPLREPARRLQSVDFVINHEKQIDGISPRNPIGCNSSEGLDPVGCHPSEDLDPVGCHPSEGWDPVLLCKNSVATKSISPECQGNNNIYNMWSVLKDAYFLDSFHDQRPLTDWAGKTVHAIAGIGDPERFFAMLRAKGIHVIAHAFDDHHAFVQSDFVFSESHPIIMTEKDAVKCKHFSVADAWVVPMNVQLPELFCQQLLQRIEGNGQKTA